MWMHYAAQSWTKVADQATVVARLNDEFTAYEFEASHEAIYGNGLYSPEYCNELSEKYQRGIKICEDYVSGGACGACFVRKLVAAKLENFIVSYLEFFPEAEQLVQPDVEEKEEEIEEGVDEVDGKEEDKE